MSLRPLLVGAALLTAVGAPCRAVAQTLSVPQDFTISVFAEGLARARFLAVDPKGTLLLSLPHAGRIVALPDGDRDGRADRVVTVADNLDLPHGMVFHEGKLYVGLADRVVRFHYDPRVLRATNPQVIVASLPCGGNHPYKTVTVGPDQRLYVSVGSSCNVCEERDRRRAAILRYNLDGTGETLVATGVRNAVGIAFNPATGRLWATINERDWRGDDLPPDYITEIAGGGFYGWPYCYVLQGRPHPDPDPPFARPERCVGMAIPTLEIQAHSAPIGLTFYTGSQFPAEYRGDLFVVYRGSWNRSVPTGYKLVRVRMRAGQPQGIEDFARGWLEEGRVHGRPVDAAVGGDGSLYLTDQGSGRVYRISYVGSR